MAPMEATEVGMSGSEGDGELPAVRVTAQDEVGAALCRAFEVGRVVGEKDRGGAARSLRKDAIQIGAVRPAIVDATDEERAAHLVAFVA